jgi:hypothetical protein
MGRGRILGPCVILLCSFTPFFKISPAQSTVRVTEAGQPRGGKGFGPSCGALSHRVESGLAFSAARSGVEEVWGSVGKPPCLYSVWRCDAQSQQIMAPSERYNPSATTCIIMIVGEHRVVPQPYWCNVGCSLSRGEGGKKRRGGKTQSLSDVDRDSQHDPTGCRLRRLLFAFLSTWASWRLFFHPTHSFADRPVFQLPQIPWPPQPSKLGP